MDKNDSLDSKFGFMYRACSCYVDSMRYWLSIPEFRNEIEALLSQGVQITDDLILPIMQNIYEKKILERRELRKNGIQSDFQAGVAKSGIRDLKKAVNSH